MSIDTNNTVHSSDLDRVQLDGLYLKQTTSNQGHLTLITKQACHVRGAYYPNGGTTVTSIDRDCAANETIVNYVFCRGLWEAYEK